MSALSLERSGGQLVLRANRSTFLFWFGAFFTGFSVVWLVSWVVQGTPGTPNFWFGLVGFLFVLIGNFMMLPHHVITTFDLRTHRAERDIAIANGLYRSRRNIPFSEIASLGAERFSDDGDRAYLPVLRLRDGVLCRLVIWSIRHDDYLRFRDSMAAPICEATGIAYKDRDE